MTKQSRRTTKPPPRVEALSTPSDPLAPEDPLDDASSAAQPPRTSVTVASCHTPGCACLNGPFFMSMVSLGRSAVRIVPCADLSIERMMQRAGRTTHRTDDLVARLASIARRRTSNKIERVS